MFVYLLTILIAIEEPARVPIGTQVPELSLRDADGKIHQLCADQAANATVVFFLGTQCPLARLYSSRIASIVQDRKKESLNFVAIDPHQCESESDIRDFEREFKPGINLLRDPGQIVADTFGVTHVPSVVVLDRERFIRYRGRIDDQYTFAARKAKPSREDLQLAIDAVVGGRPVEVAEVSPDGCPIDRANRPPGGGAITWSNSAADIIARRCAICHRAGYVAPFALQTYKETTAHSEGILEAIRDGRMPPWSAGGPHGVFSNDARLLPEERKQLLEWIDGGCPEGEPTTAPLLEKDDWEIPKPDLVVPIPIEFEVPAEGVVDYQIYNVPLGFKEDVWVRAVEIRPGNRAVVHHCSVFLKPPGSETPMSAGSLGSFCLATTTQLKQKTVLPDGMAKRIPAGWELSFTLHYTPIGKPAKDRTCIGLVFEDPAKVRQEVATACLLDEELVIPPHEKHFETVREWTAPVDVLLLSLFPHMHLRGKNFTYELFYPSGEKEMLLNVERWDYNWQHKYEFASPRRLPKGTVIRCTGVYDNSTSNPANPDPSATVRAGKQAWDEMFNGYFDWAVADQDMIAERHWTARTLRALSHPLSGLFAVIGIVVLLRRMRKPGGLNL